jgi:ERCC4-type nuclease
MRNAIRGKMMSAMAKTLRRILIPSPLSWQASADPVPPPAVPVLAERGGTQLTTPRGVLVIDTREQNPFDFSRFRAWFSSVEQKALKLGDYSIAGLEDYCAVERKDLSDLVHSFTGQRAVFIERLKRMSAHRHRLLVVTSSVAEIKSRYVHSSANPNRVLQSLIATLVGLGVPFLTTETHELGAEVVASYLYQIHLYHWLEANDYGRYLADNDL